MPATHTSSELTPGAHGRHWDLPRLGWGVGLRTVHYPHLREHTPRVDWFEAISENYLDSHGRPRAMLDMVAARFPLVLHGVSLSIGSHDPLDRDYLAKLKRLADDLHVVWVSDHVCWTGVLGKNTHDLLPLPLNEATLQHVVARIRIVQDLLERPLILENPSSYVTFHASTIPEAEFMARMADEADCGLLLDVNNVYVSSRNHGFDPVAYIESIPVERVAQFHLAGHTDLGTHVIDTHDAPVVDTVWDLYRLAIQRMPQASTLLEWDAHIPPFPRLEAELDRARAIFDNPPGTPTYDAEDLSSAPLCSVVVSHPPVLVTVEAE